MSDLKKLRRQWEWDRRLELITEFQPDQSCNDLIIVILKSSQESHSVPQYHLHRYFKVGGNWLVSVDKQGSGLDMFTELQRIFPVKVDNVTA